MRLSRITLYGGLIGGAALWVYLASDGLIGVAARVGSVFDVLVMLGLILAVLTEDVGARPQAYVGTRLRAIRHRRSTVEMCSVCARPIVDTGVARFCPACDQIPATLAG